MKMSKYKFTEETREYNGVLLHRIEAVRDIKLHGVCAGDVGGWIESTINLSHTGEAWVDGNAIVMNNAFVSGNAHVTDEAVIDCEACVNGNAIVGDKAKVSDKARVSDFAYVSNNARVEGHASIYDEAWIMDNAVIAGSARIQGCCGVCDTATVYGSAIIDGQAVVRENAQVFGNAFVDGATHLPFGALIQSDRDFITIGPFDNLGEDHELRHLTFFKTTRGDIEVTCGDKAHTLLEYYSMFCDRPELIAAMTVAQIALNKGRAR